MSLPIHLLGSSSALKGRTDEELPYIAPDPKNNSMHFKVLLKKGNKQTIK
jgi:hypothetical protein